MIKRFISLSSDTSLHLEGVFNMQDFLQFFIFTGNYTVINGFLKFEPTASPSTLVLQGKVTLELELLAIFWVLKWNKPKKTMENKVYIIEGKRTSTP